MSVGTSSLYGPTYSEMRDPEQLDPSFRRGASKRQTLEPLHRDNLYNVHWQDEGSGLSAFLVPQEITGLRANVLVMDGSTFPSGSMKVGPAYAMLMEHEIRTGMRPGQATIIAPSTGNFGIGAAWVAKVKGYQAKVVMPAGMSKERYQLIESLGANTDLTPGSESDVHLTLKRTRDRYSSRSDCVVLGQFSDLANYRFHRYVTAFAIKRALAAFELPSADLFVSAPGSAGTLAAGEGLREFFSNVRIAAVEPEECATLTRGGKGAHVIEGIGDQMVTFIHNLDATDLVVTVPGNLTIKGMAAFSSEVETLSDGLGVNPDAAAALHQRFGPSGICNLIGSILAARLLNLGPTQTVVTIATDGLNRYASILEKLDSQLGRLPNKSDVSQWWAEILGLDTESQVQDLGSGAHRNRLHEMKEATWLELGCDRNQLSAMRSPEFWDAQYAEIPDIDQKWAAARTPLGGT